MFLVQTQNLHLMVICGVL